jgi:hypothetical protein
MLVQITVRIGDREVQRERTIGGTPAEREEAAHVLGQQIGQIVSEAALSEAAGDVRHPCCCGRAMENRGRRPILLQGLDGPLKILRTRYRCRSCQRESYPADGLLLCGRRRVSGPLAKRVCQLATIEHFTRLPQLLFDQHGVRLSHNEIVPLVHDVGGAVEAERLAEVAAWEHCPDKHCPAAEVTSQRIDVSCDGIMDCTNEREPHPDDPNRQRMKWQQMRVGCVYWQDGRERWHKRVIWGRKDAQTFGASLYRLACRCGYRQATERIFAADGGEWCWSIHQQYFTSAQGILDWYHVSEHVWQAAGVLHLRDGTARKAWAGQALGLLREQGGRGREQGGRGLVGWLVPQRKSQRGAKRIAIESLLGYLQPRRAITDYPQYRRRGWQIGSGMIESTAKQLVGLRLKGPGMHWSEPGALAVTALRAQDLNGHWNQLWANLSMNA